MIGNLLYYVYWVFIWLEKLFSLYLYVLYDVYKVILIFGVILILIYNVEEFLSK